MIFNEQSFLVRFYIKKINEGFPKENVPNLFNLKEVVYAILDAEQNDA